MATVKNKSLVRTRAALTRGGSFGPSLSPHPLSQKRIFKKELCVQIQLKKGYEKAPHRALLHTTGLQDEDFISSRSLRLSIRMLMLCQACAFTGVQQVGEKAVRAAGCVPFEFNTIGVDDGIAMGAWAHEVFAAFA